MLAGRNARKIDYLEAAVRAGLHVLSDKPWILVPEHVPRLQRLLDDADRQGLVAYDIMTERYEVTSILQRELVQDAGVFGEPVPGSADEPGVYMESVHFLKKLVAGAPLKRPAWFFDGLGGKPADWDAPRLLAMMRQLQPHLVINNRAGIPGDRG